MSWFGGLLVVLAAVPFLVLTSMIIQAINKEQ